MAARVANLVKKIQALRNWNVAATYSKAGGDIGLLARIRLQILERSSDAGAPFQVSLPLSSEALKAVRASGDKRILTEAHIRFGPLEARRGDTQVAKRHLRHATRLLNETPNRLLQASTQLTLAVIASIEGGIETARDLSIQAELDSTLSNWEKGRAIAAGNLGYYYLCLGNLPEAERRLAQAEASTYSTPNYRYALVDTRDPAGRWQSATSMKPIDFGRFPSGQFVGLVHGTACGVLTSVFAH